MSRSKLKLNPKQMSFKKKIDKKWTKINRIKIIALFLMREDDAKTFLSCWFRRVSDVELKNLWKSVQKSSFYFLEENESIAFDYG